MSPGIIPTPSNPAGKFDENRNGQPSKDIVDIGSSSDLGNSQSSHSEHALPTTTDKRTSELLCEMAAKVGFKNIDLSTRRANDGKERCKLCDHLLPDGYLELWRDLTEKCYIPLGMWQKICQDHKQQTLRDEWKKKKYPDIKWTELKNRVSNHIRLLRDITANKVTSRFREEFATQQKETGGITAKLLRQERRLPNPGYYGPRGAEILCVDHAARNILGGRWLMG
jgi:hypothetical protein